MIKAIKNNGKRARWKDRNKNRSSLEVTGEDEEDSNISSGDSLSSDGARASGYIPSGTSGGVLHLGQVVDAVGGVRNYAATTTGSSSINLSDERR
ncbi:hypothetical protein N5V81_12880 [Escherichia coli]|nr:hypothetical protein [Escherichia coli]